jgi:alpha-tubulin suppressor-like RCC1 family protein
MDCFCLHREQTMDCRLFDRRLVAVFGLLIIGAYGCPTDGPGGDEQGTGSADAADAEVEPDTAPPEDTETPDDVADDTSETPEDAGMDGGDDPADTGTEDTSSMDVAEDTSPDTAKMDGGQTDVAPDSGSPDTGGGGDPGRWQKIVAGGDHTCGIEQSDGSICCWGRGGNGEENADKSGTFQDVAAGSRHNCAVKTSGEIVCWGETELAGEQTPPSGTNFVEVGVGITHGCARTTTNKVECWGSDKDGQSTVPTGSSGNLKFRKLAVGRDFTCAINDVQRINCWGNDDNGVVSDVPPGTYTDIAAGNSQVCAISRTSGNAFCWGRGISGSTDDKTGMYKAIAGGGNFNCAIAGNDSLTCWGDNSYGQANDRSGTYTLVAAGFNHSCAVESTQGLQCWGGNVPNSSDPPEYASPPKPSECTN